MITRKVALSGQEKRKALYATTGHSSAVHNSVGVGINAMILESSSGRNIPLLKQASCVVSSINDESSSDRLIRFEDKDDEGDDESREEDVPYLLAS